LFRHKISIKKREKVVADSTFAGLGFGVAAFFGRAPNFIFSDEPTMTNQFHHLSQPLQLRHKTLRNRIVFGSHTAKWLLMACLVSVIVGIMKNVPAAVQV
jgi:hypothetical protein